MKLTTLLVALLLIAALQTALLGQAKPPSAARPDSEFRGATQPGVTPPDWRNPILVVGALGVTFVERPGSTRRWIPAADIETLESLFSALPSTAWPHGRTVFIDSPHSFGGADGVRVRGNTRRVMSILDRLQISETNIVTGC